MRAARWISIAAHPFVMVGVLVASAARRAGAQTLESVLLVSFFTIVPLTVLMVRQVRRGAWENADASNRRDRPPLYTAATAALLLLFGYLALLQPQSFMIRGAAATLAMLAACATVTIWIKVSLHMAFGTLAATALALPGSVVGYVLLPVLPVLAWARLVLARHTPLEVAGGTFLGLAAGAAIHVL